MIKTRMKWLNVRISTYIVTLSSFTLNVMIAEAILSGDAQIHSIDSSHHSSNAPITAQ